MNWLIFHIAGGSAFFAGVVLIVLAAILSWPQKRWLQALAPLFCIVGLIAIVVSATPLPWTFYIVAGCISLVWLVALNFKRLGTRPRRVMSVVLAGSWSAAAATELPYHFLPHVPPTRTNTITLLADSVSAGISDRESATWPKILERSRSVKVHDYSKMGATVASALKTAKGVDIPEGIVLLEIGGNDLLGSTSALDFDRNLDTLLAYVSGGKHQVVMFELPLLPFCNSFGRSQRTLTAKYNVQLIPRRVLLQVLTADDATLDSIHLSKSGHQQMADLVWQILGPSLAEGR